MTSRLTLTDNLDISRIIYGMWRLGDDSDTSPAHVQKKIETCLEQGISTLDQADIYGDYGAEAILGDCLKQAPALRDKIEIITKCNIVAPVGRYSDARVKYYDTSRAHILASVDHSLRLMNTDQIDILLVHRPDPFMHHVETGAALDEVVNNGKVRAVGVSNFKPHDWSLLQSAMSTKLCTNQIEISVLAHEAFVNGDIAFMQQHSIHPMAWSPMSGGTLFSSEGSAVRSVLEPIAKTSGVDVAAVAVAWLLAHPANIAPVMGTNNLNRIRTIGEAMNVTLDRETWFEIYSAALGNEVP